HPIPSTSSSLALAAVFFMKALLTLENASSIGERSGEVRPPRTEHLAAPPLDELEYALALVGGEVLQDHHLPRP
ncbi:MAG: hypothetical protein ACJ732_05070, partial [Rubrobacteraceae bacterium]